MKKWFPEILLVCSLGVGCGGSKEPAPSISENTKVTQKTTTTITSPAPIPTLTATPTATPVVDENLKKGQDLAISRNYTDALPLLEKALKSNPDNPDANLWPFICRKHLETSRQPATLAAAKKVVALMPGTQGGKQAQDYVDGISTTPSRPAPESSASAAPSSTATPGGDEAISDLRTALTLSQQRIAKLSGDSAAEVQKNHTDAIEQAQKEDFAGAIKTLELNLPLLTKMEAGASPDNAKQLGLAQAETQFCLGLANEKAKNLAEARRYLALAAADNKGATEEWEGKSEWDTTQKFAKAELEKIK